ncbi:hypothetical protein KKR91_01060 [Arthrobacter jiangjiafuii]|uniref:Lipoprotein n=1 Tax=Arthrobacter jiangjiafuii TaxID=2817475 RepID=A0A975M5S5_9MICC|nr:hypothetical protein [Arthrobacter jiangjiafuii]MBP3044903.1 hypothetical protein [Arthrobacter jiangjiafuii]QWC10274.1 hypothetical protein KKR91_01060 [Arthrobacter jiangjiafuii]
MRKTAAIPAIALMLVTGCSAEAVESGSSSASAPAPAAPSAAAPSAETAAQDTEEATCLKLLETDGKGPLYNAIHRVQFGGGTSGFQGTADDARVLQEELDGIAATAPHTLALLLEGLVSPLESVAGQAADPGSAWNFNVDIWKGAVSGLLSRCAPYEASETAATYTVFPGTIARVVPAYPGYPLVVDAASLDYRVAAWYDGRLVDGRVVALAPGLYTPHDPNIPDLLAYYVPAGTAGDTARKLTVFPDSSRGGTWSGVLPGTQEPQL